MRRNLQCHSVNNQLHCQESSVSWDTISEDWEFGAGNSVFVNEVPDDLVQDSGPECSNGVDFVQAVRGLVGEGVGGQTGGEQVRSDTLGVIVDPITEWVVGSSSVGGLEVDSDSEEISPTLAHSTGLEDTQTVGVCWATCQSVGKAVGVFVDNDTCIKSAITVWCGVSPHEHSHSWLLSIDGSGKVGVVGT